MSPSTRRDDRRQQMDAVIRRYASFVANRSDLYWRLIRIIRSQSSLLKPRPWRGRIGINQLLLACMRLVWRSQLWVRPPETWVAPAANASVQFRSLVSHLLDEYPVPPFMPLVWLQPDARWEIDLYLHLASGRSVRQFESQHPRFGHLCVTKRMARLFMTAPDDFSPAAALRWAQVCALGGDYRLARGLAGTVVLSSLTNHEVFWEQVIRFLIREQPFCCEEAAQIVDFVHRQRFQPAEKVWGEGAGDSPLQPDLSLQGRSLMSLRRHMTNWRTELVSRRPNLISPACGWPGTDIRPLQLCLGPQTWTIEELRSDQQLRAEGGIMGHCVALYISDCARGQTSIWSMRVRDEVRVRRVMTIEVHPRHRRILEFRGKTNSMPDELPMKMLQRWADQEQLVMPSRI